MSISVPASARRRAVPSRLRRRASCCSSRAAGGHAEGRRRRNRTNPCEPAASFRFGRPDCRVSSRRRLPTMSMRASRSPSTEPVPAKRMRGRSSIGPSMPWQGGRGRPRRLDDPVRQSRRAESDPRSIRGLVAQLSAGHEPHHVGESTLSLVLNALGDSLLGPPIAQALGLPRDTARELAAQRLRHRLEVEHQEI